MTAEEVKAATVEAIGQLVAEGVLAGPRPAVELLSVRQVCEALRITEHTFYAYRKRYVSFRTVKVGGRLYMRRETLERFLRRLEEAQAY